MNRRVVVVFALSLLVLTPMVVYAATSMEHIISDQSTDFDRVTAEINTKNTSSGFTLSKKTGSRDSFFNNMLKKTSGNLDVTNDRIKVGTGWNRFDQIGPTASENFEWDYSETGDGAYYQGTHYFLDSWYTSGPPSQTGWDLYKWKEGGLTEVDGTSGFSGAALAHWKDDKLLVITNNGEGSLATTHELWSYDIGSDSGSKLKDSFNFENDKVVAGAAGSVSTGDVWIIFENGLIERYHVASDGNYWVVESWYANPSGLTNPSGLSYNQKTGRLYTFDESDSHLKLIGPNNGIISSKSYSNQYWAVGAVDHGNGENFSHGKVTLFNQRKDSVVELATEDLTHDYNHKWTSKRFSLAPEYESISGIDVTFNAPQLWGNYKVVLRKKEADESSWTTIGSKTGDEKTTFDGSNFDVNSSGVQFRLKLIPGQHHGLRRGERVRVESFNLDYSYYAQSGQVLGHAENNSDLGIDMGRAKEIKYLNFSGLTELNSQIDLNVVNKDGQTVYSASSIIGKNLNVTGSTINESKYANQRLFLELDYSSKGLQTTEFTGFDIAYEPRPPSPKITDWFGITSEGNTTDRTIQTGTGAENTFVVQDINQSVEYIDWYVDGDVVKHQSVSGDGPYSFNTTWSDDGSHTVRGEVYNLDSGSDSVKWDVDVYYLIIGGQDSYSVGPQSSFETTQRFTVFDVPSADVNYTLEYNASVVKLLSGSEAGTISTGNSLTWEFLVQGNVSDYSGQPITIRANYRNWTTSKNITVSVGKSGGVLVSGPGVSFGNLLSNTWLELVVQGLGKDTYIVIQGILALGIFAAIWLHHLGYASIPVFGGSLASIQLWTKVLLSLGIFTLVTGFNPVFWVFQVAISAGIWWKWLSNGNISLLDEVAKI